MKEYFVVAAAVCVCVYTLKCLKKFFRNTNYRTGRDEVKMNHTFRSEVGQKEKLLMPTAL